MSLHRREGRENGSRRRRLLNGMRGPSRTDRVLPLDLRLRAIADNVPTSSIDQLWVFPPLPNREIACEFLVLVCYDGGPDRHVERGASPPGRHVADRPAVGTAG